ncbi:hypothetical protein M422DRAFT_257404 [Sphaerobolus stellatus SS14]|uniref:Uncharacterized protein n=1 Tax=Sphaerobolus stellatus (strain SS14) TaxID=990650 RepID=A0A0C9VEI0_SPHS4|nr:hypothetical protein M422DRAFT_257404 [Sphaerobolus stellatus SS14]
MSYAPPAVPPYPTNFYSQRQYRQDSKPPVPPHFHPDQSVVSPMPERIIPDLPADRSDAHSTTKQAHGIQPATPSPPRLIRLSTTEAIRRILTRPLSRRTSSAAPTPVGPPRPRRVRPSPNRIQLAPRPAAAAPRPLQREPRPLHVVQRPADAVAVRLAAFSFPAPRACLSGPSSFDEADITEDALRMGDPGNTGLMDLADLDPMPEIEAHELHEMNFTLDT